MIKQTRMAVAVSLALANLPAAVFAAESTAVNEDELVVTATGFSQERREAPATISVVNEKELNTRSNQNVTEALREMPGLLVGNGHGSLATGDVQMRGMDSTYTSYMVNGIKQATRESRPYGHHIGTEAAFMPPLAAIERIEVIRGPMSSLYGSDAIGGVVNVITKKAYNLEKWTGVLEDNYFLQEKSEYGNTNQTNAFVMGPVIPGKLGVSVAADYLDRRDDDSVNDERFVKHQSGNLDATIALSPTETQLWDLNATKGNQEKTHNDKQWYWGFDRDAASLSQHAWYGDILEVKNFVSYEKAKTEYRVPGMASQFITQKNYEANSANTFTLGDHKLTLGINFTRNELDDEFGIKDKEAPGVTPVSEISRNGWAVFAEDAWMIVPDFTLTTSARLDHDSYFGYHVTPKLYGNWTLDENWALKGGVSAGYKKPDLRQNNAGFTSVYGAYPYSEIGIGNDDLKPEESVNTELGVYWQQDALALDATVFYTKFKDKISDRVICTTSASQQCRYNGYVADSVFQYFNVSDAEIYGVELNGDWQVTSSLRANANYTWTHSEQQSGEYKGYALSDFPESMANVSLTWQALNDLELWTKASWRSTSPDIGKSSETEAYALVDLGARYHLNKNVTLMTGIYNLFDANPIYRTSYNQSSMLEGRRYNFGARIEF
ncbi:MULTISPECIES: TonB-dependent receptor domain-containing protein [Leclercia]|uniref:TonB-dependent receptor domain-containing protein n=1 Tax=Leclercia TaxID=83654 RepID=UPI000CD207D4|nr:MULTISPECIES: TonB-dependent receptor [unclassified Leclercia]MCZ7839393.1 TonB-dependent receptor [Leclercia adecarboxylata]POV35785.1 TonB-dependent receptor [Leclercia sp. LSNIH5]POW65107.1 TonB-dependent receptor [Leclercia sp. LSNIH2]AUU85494.1 TonB-dependent receptor [Leclercia sp. LSNIH1]QVV60079.1 TonB-dependent receptor [Leclercia sp. Colony189]